MRTLWLSLVALAMVGSVGLYALYARAEQTKTEENMNKKSIILYFSRADENYGVGYVDKGNTEYIAEFIQQATGADMYRADPAVPYAKDYDTCVKEAQTRQSTHQAPVARPAPDIASYDVVYIGSPVYWGVMPEELKTALTGLDFTGKTVYVFTTHEGSGLGSVPEQVKEICAGATFGKPLAVYGHQAAQAQKTVEAWLAGHK